MIFLSVTNNKITFFKNLIKKNGLVKDGYINNKLNLNNFLLLFSLNIHEEYINLRHFINYKNSQIVESKYFVQLTLIFL